MLSSVGTPNVARSSAALTKSSVLGPCLKIFILLFQTLRKSLLIMGYQPSYLQQASHNRTQP
jgi:hypothetical protein